MTFSQALAVRNEPREGLPEFRVLLAFSSTPLHLETFLSARLLQALPGRCVTVQPGPFGDAAGAIESLGEDAAALAVVLEWPDFDPRLDLREQASWTPAELEDAAATAPLRAQRLLRALEGVPPGVAVAVCGPTLPLPPAFSTPNAQGSAAALRLRAVVADFLARAAASPAVRVVHPEAIDRRSPLDRRLDIGSHLIAGLPYKRRHADLVAEVLTAALAPATPKKGLITDLDDTFWKGLVGEIGADAVSWDLDGKSRLHGLYQQLLASLAAQGVLLAIASKNEEPAALEALERSDTLVEPDRFFPVEIHWEPKSAAVARILQAWNVGADSVVFIDDSPYEIAEVEQAHPEVECFLFPKNDPSDALALFERLRDLFGKPSVEQEDALRLDSLRAAAELDATAQGASADDLLARAEARITFDWKPSGGRPLELINKTNQFNLNGVRRTESDWQASLEAGDRFAVAVDYADKFSPLGVIAVLTGRLDDDQLVVDSWVMSCRAFSRRIEHRCLEVLFERFGADQVRLEFRPTAKNAPLRQFLESVAGGEIAAGEVVLDREAFERVRPQLYQKVEHIP